MRILLPLDFSENSKKTFDFAIILAKKKNATITILHVIEAIYDFAAQAAIVIDGMHRDAEKYIQGLIEDTKKEGVQMDYLIKEGTVSIMTAKTAEEINADLIVLGTHGASGIEQKLFGSKSVEVVKNSVCPVLLVPSEAKIEHIEKVTLALEFAEHEEPFIEWVISLSKNWNLQLEFLHIQLQRNFKEELCVLGLEAFVQKNYPEIPVKLHTFYSEDLINGLEQYLSKNDDTILVMCHHHKNLWEQILTKSKSLQMAYHTHVPLLIMT